MAMAWIWTGMVALSLLFGAVNGRMEAVSAAALSGASAAVELALSMAGTLMLWNGVVEIMKRTGLSEAAARLSRPLLGRLFPKASADTETLSALSANLSANLLGLGNAATPFGVQAARRMAKNCHGTASEELCLLVVLNTASVQLFPATAVSLRTAAGCAAPTDILPAVWLTSLASVIAGLSAARLLSVLSGYFTRNKTGYFRRENP